MSDKQVGAIASGTGALVNQAPAGLGPNGLRSPIAEIRVAIQRGLLAELGDTYDCTRVWSAWSYGTMDEDDFVPVLDRLEDLIDSVSFHIAELLRSPQHAAEANPKVLPFSELEPDGYEAERTRRDADQAGGGSEDITRCTPLLAGSLQRGERTAAVGGNEPHGLTESAAVCDMCNGSGVVGYPPDDYWNCPDCFAQVGTRRMAETGTGSGRSPSDAVAEGHAPNTGDQS